jgi:iron complex transport system permease protein
MGTLSKASLEDVSHVGPPMLIGLVYLALNGKTLNLLSQGEHEAMTLGVNYSRVRIILIAAATLICSLSVMMAGIVMWVGLAVPHLVRLTLGANNLTVLPVSAIIGALFLLLTDTIVRLAWTIEFPLGVMTALLGLPVFALTLYFEKGRT